MILRKVLFIITIVCFLMTGLNVFAETEIVAKKVSDSPVIDGDADLVWSSIKATRTIDFITKKEVLIKAANDGENIYFLIQFQDDNENRLHRPYHWDSVNKLYGSGPEREDTFVIKWNMSPYDSDLTLSEIIPYTADVWFWKASRTDPVGFADDKIQHYSPVKAKGGTAVVARNGKIFYIFREGDEGKSSYVSAFYPEYVKDVMPSYNNRQPKGSRADIRAKGLWKNGLWTIEFARKLSTGNKDDIDLSDKKPHVFGVSINEIAGRKKELHSSNPYYGVGDVGELFKLTIE